VIKSPCDQHCSHLTSAASHGVTAKRHTCLTASSSTCSDAHGPSSTTVKASWLSVALTSDLEVVVQMRPYEGSHVHHFHSENAAAHKDILSSRLAACRGVKTTKSEPHFARVACANIRDLRSQQHGLLPLPLPAECVVAKDLSTRSTVSYPPTVLRHNGDGIRTTSPAQGQLRTPVPSTRCCNGVPAVSKEAGVEDVIDTVLVGHERGQPSSPLPSLHAPTQDHQSRHNAAAHSFEWTMGVACELPTIAVLIRTPQHTKRALLVLHPTVTCPRKRGHRHKGILAYHASLWPVSESMQHVAVSPQGEDVFVVGGQFVRVVLPCNEPAGALAEKVKGDELHLILRGGYVNLADTAGTGGMLRPLLFHVGLHGSSARQRRACRSVMRGLVTGVWCRCGLWLIPLSSGAHHRSHRGVTEVVMYSTEGHALVFQPVHQAAAATTQHTVSNPSHCDASAGRRNEVASRPQLTQTVAVAYACCYGARLPYSLLSGCAAVVTGQRSRVSAPLLIAPPWRFVDQWCHSQWFRAALVSSTSGMDAAAISETADGNGAAYAELSRHRRRHTPSAVLAMSANRRVWLLGAGAYLSLVTVPSCVVADRSAGNDGTAVTATVSCTAAAASLSTRYTLDDAQFVECGGHGGFLLLCRCRGSDPRGDGGGGGLVPAAVTAPHTTVTERYIHCVPTCPVRVFFLSLLSMNAPGVGAGLSASSSLFPLPVQWNAPSGSQGFLSTLLRPTQRLRFACAAALDDGESVLDVSVPSVYVTIVGSGNPRHLWTASATIPTLSTWCNTHLLSAVCREAGESGGSTPHACPLPARVRQWTTHAFSAAFPHTTLTRSTRRIDTLAKVLCNPSSSSSSCAGNSLERLVEVALLYVDDSRCDPSHRVRDDVRGVTDILHSTLEAFVGVATSGDACDAVAGECVACVTAVFAGFSAALCMSGLLSKAREEGTGAAAAGTATLLSSAARQGCVAPSAELPTTLPVLRLLHRSAQLLQHALEGLCIIGHISALLACVSHLAQTRQTISQGSGDAVAVGHTTAAACTPRAVWTLLLQPLFDLVWGVLQDYGLPASVTADVLLYCSPALRSMVRVGSSWFVAKDGMTKHVLHGTLTAASTSLTDKGSGCRSAGDSGAVIMPETKMVAERQSILATPVVSAQPSPPFVTTPPSSSSPPTTAYSSSELYEVVQRVFLLQGAEAALRLVHQMRQHESTRDGVAEMAEVYEAMQQRLDRIVA
jgi:hypothetical protein